MELCLILCGSLDGKGVCGRIDTCICMAESLHYSPEIQVNSLSQHCLLTGYTPIQNKFFLKKVKRQSKQWEKIFANYISGKNKM